MCFGLVGNVWEWTADDPRTEADSGYAWVFGGSFMHEGQRQDRIARTSVSIDNAYHYLGFRCARDLDP